MIYFFKFKGKSRICIFYCCEIIINDFLNGKLFYNIGNISRIKDIEIKKKGIISFILKCHYIKFKTIKSINISYILINNI